MSQQESGEHLAPVTYLFGTPDGGAEPAAEVAQSIPASETPPTAPAVERRMPTFASTFGDHGHDEFEPIRGGTREPASAAPPAERPSRAPRAENVSMHALTRRGMSVAEMTDLLERRELDPDDVATEIERLAGVGLLDDELLAETLVRTLHERKGLGRSAIAAELRRRKVEGSALEVALEAIDDDDELSRATEVAEKRAGQLRSLAPEVAKRRLMAFMQRRGYSGSVLSTAVSAALSGSGPQSSGGPRFR